MKYRMIIFDFDGTLADSFPWLMSVANQVADRYEFKRIEESEFETLRGYSAGGMLKHLGVPRWKVPLIGNHIRTLMAQEISRISLFEGVDRLLRQLHTAGITLAIVSSNSYGNVQHVLGPENAALITYYECGVSIFGKEAKFRNVLRKSGVPRSQTICIGDEIRDMEAARKERIAFGAVSWGATAVEALRAYAPAEVFAGIDEIVEKVT